MILRHKPSAVEVMDKSILDNTRQNAALESHPQTFIPGDPGATLCVEFYADQRKICRRASRRSKQDLRERSLGYRLPSGDRPAAQAHIWSLREAALGLSTAMKEDAKSISFVEDTAVAPEKLRDFIGRFLEDRPQRTKPRRESTRTLRSAVFTSVRSSI